MTISELCIRRPVMTTLVMAAIVIFGIAGYLLLPISALPNVDFPTIQVTAQLPGASPDTMASAVATPLERQFSTISGVRSMNSTSVLGVTQITLQFDLDRNIDGAALDVQSAITEAAPNLPVEMTTPPSFRKVNPAEQAILFMTLSSSTLPLSTVDEYAETTIGEHISTLPGVAQVEVFGAQKYAVRVQVNPQALAARGISFGDVQKAVAAATSNTPVGALDGSHKMLTIKTSGEPQDAAAYRPLIVAYRNGRPVRLDEVAQVVDSVQNDKVASWYDGRRAILLAVQRQPGANTVAVVKRIKALMPAFRAELPPSVNFSLVHDHSEPIRNAISEVRLTLGITAALVILVIFLFLRKLQATLIPALALPVSLIGTFAGMYLMGFNLDNISLLALTLSVGFVVDDAIVMLENIVRHIEAGEKPLAAALKGGREISFTILSMTFSLVAVFIPVLFMGGVVGRLFREFAVTISIAILVSGFVSLTLTPMLCSRILRQHSVTEEGWFGRGLERAFAAAHGAYRRSLAAVLKHSRLMLGVIAVTLIATVIGFAAIPKGFFPIEDTGFIFASTEGPQDISFAAMEARQKAVMKVIAADPAITSVTSSIGSTGASALNAGRLFMSMKPRDERPGVMQVIQRLRGEVAKIPGVKVYFQPVQNLNLGGHLTKGQYQYTLQSSDLDQLYKWTPILEKKLRALPGFQDVTSDLELSSPQAVVKIDHDRAASLGVTTEAIRNTLYSAFGSRQVATIYTPSDDYQVILEAEPSFQENTAGLSSLYVQAANGKLVPLDAISTITEAVGPLSVSHLGQLPAVTISFNLKPGVALGQAVAAIKKVEHDSGMPASISTSFQGTAQFFEDAEAGQGLLLLAAVAVIYIILGILYESFIHPITILSGLPAAGLGAILTLMVFHEDLTIIALIGIIMLIGIVKKNAILMIDFALERKRAGETDPRRAIFEACMLRFRPIMMTTMAAIMGSLPIAIGTGAGSELRQPLGLAVVGGLLVSQLLTLYITPVVYVYLDQIQARLTPRGVHPLPAETQVSRAAE